MKKLLYIAYHFPPHGGAGVQRSAKFVKYLPSFGIQPTVLTDVGATDQNWSPVDTTLEAEIPADGTVVRTPWPQGSSEQRRSSEHKRLEVGVRLIAQRGIEAILVSMSPFTDAPFAARLAARCGIPWIADLRDPWALDEFQVYRTRWHRHRALQIMREALSSAALVIMNTPEAAAALKRVFPEMASRTTSITNGYDSDEVAPSAEAHRTEHFNIVHAGFLHAEAGLRQKRQMWQYNVLGRMEPGVAILPRSHYYLLRALAVWRTEDPDVDEKVRVTLVGKTRPIDRELVVRSPVAPLVRFTDYLSHAASLNLVQDASMLFLPMHKLPAGRRARIVPGKTYEYMASGRPVLAPIPEGDAQDFLRRAGTGLICAPDSVQEMVAILRRRFRAWASGESGPRVDAGYVSRFERRTLTGQLASLLRALTHARAPESTIAK